MFVLSRLVLRRTIFINSSCRKGNSNEELFSVKKIVDGDTFWADDGSEKGLKIRLIVKINPLSILNFFNSIRNYLTTPL